MTRKEALTDLLERIESGNETENDYVSALPEEKPHGQCRWHVAVRAASGSIEAAKHLHDSVLPYYDVDLEVRSLLSDATIYDPAWDEDVKMHRGCHELISRAWLIAIIKALIAECDEVTA